MRNFLRNGWRIDAQQWSYEPVGYGGHHWTAVDGGRGFFISLIALDGPNRLAWLGAAMRTAITLRAEAGLEFVVAPLPGKGGEPVLIFDDSWAVTVQPFLEGRPWPSSASERGALVAVLAQLHGAPEPTMRFARRDDFALAARVDLEDALGAVGVSWDAGPHSEACRNLLSAAHDAVLQRLTDYDVHVTDCLRRAPESVLTHGEPKDDNVLATESGEVLVDWDTVLIAPAARDLWWLVEQDPEAHERYEALTGRGVDPRDLDLYRLRWDLTDTALFIRQLRAPHADDDDTAVALRALQHLLSH